jgi:hypothetical protein
VAARAAGLSWDDVLPVEVKELPADLAALDVVLSADELLWPLMERSQQEFRETGRLVLTRVARRSRSRHMCG